MYHRKYYYSIKLAREAIINDEAFKKLKKLAQNAKYNLDKIAETLEIKLGVNFNPIHQEGFEYTLKSLNLSKLLYKERSDISLDKFIF